MIAFALLRFCVDSFNDRAELKTNEAATNGAYGLKKTGGCVKTPKNSQSPDFPKPGLCYVQKFLYL